jgi:hypothetical protein
MAENSKPYSSNTKCLAFASCFDVCSAVNDGGHFSGPEFCPKNYFYSGDFHYTPWKI